MINLLPIIESLFSEFAIFSLLILIKPISQLQFRGYSLKDLDDSASLLTSWSGIIFTGLWIVFTVQDFGEIDWTVHSEEYKNPSFMSLSYWLKPIFYLVISQMLWFNYVRNNKWMRIVIASLFLFSFDQIFRFIISLHRDYLPSSWQSVFYIDSFFHLLANWIIFIILVFVIFFFKKQLLERDK